MSLTVEFARASRVYQVAEPGSTCDRLISAAERLFAEHGVEGVSLRQICLEAGQRNTRALQYHFVNRLGIVRALLLTRMAWIETRRGALLTALSEQALTPDLYSLMDVLLRPFSELVDDHGRNLYARFSTSVLTHTYAWATSQIDAVAQLARVATPTPTEQALTLIGGQVTHLTSDELSRRLSHVLRMFLGAIIDRENTLASGGEHASLEATIREQVAMAAAAVSARSGAIPRPQVYPNKI